MDWWLLPPSQIQRRSDCRTYCLGVVERRINQACGVCLMPRTASAGLQTYLASLMSAGEAGAYRADLLKITLPGGAIYRWTTAEVDVTCDGNTYSASDGSTVPFFKRSNITQMLDLQVSTMDVDLAGILNSLPIGQVVSSHFFDGAAVELRLLISTGPTDTANGSVSWFTGNVAGFEVKKDIAQLHVKSDIEKINVALPRFTLSPSCRNIVYDANCGLVCASWTLAGTVSARTSTTLTTATAGITAKGAGY